MAEGPSAAGLGSRARTAHHLCMGFPVRGYWQDWPTGPSLRREGKTSRCRTDSPLAPLVFLEIVDEKSRHSLHENMSKIKAPTQVIWGKQDQVGSPLHIPHRPVSISACAHPWGHSRGCAAELCPALRGAGTCVLSPVDLDTGAQQGDGQKADSQLSRGRRGQCQGWGVRGDRGVVGASTEAGKGWEKE